MSASHDKNPSGFRAAERITLDVRVPISDDDCEMKHSWRNIPVPPGPPEEGWQVLDKHARPEDYLAPPLPGLLGNVPPRRRRTGGCADAPDQAPR
jgi:hypothetical protein